MRDQINAGRLRGLLAENLYDDTRSYLEACGGMDAVPLDGFVLGTHTWALKAFIHNTLRQYLTNPNISATFFPVVRYHGTPVGARGSTPLESPMLHFMLMCRFDEYQTPFPSYFPGDYLAAVSSVAVTAQGNLGWDPQPGEPPTPVGKPSSSTWLQQLIPPFLNGSTAVR